MSKSNPKISICVPAHKGMKDHDFFLERLLASIEKQTFTDYEVVLTYKGKMAENTNTSMREAKGEIIKILYLDDYLSDENALQHIVDAFEKEPEKVWLATGCVHDNRVMSDIAPHTPSYSTDILTGNNTIGSPSVVALRSGLEMYFDETLSWLLDCDLYYRLHNKYGDPILLSDLDVAIGVGDHQTSVLMSDEAKEKEHSYLLRKYI